LYQKWKTISFRNSKMEAEIQNMKNYIDTVGNQDPEMRKATDIENLKKTLREELEIGIAEQKTNNDNMFIEFRPNQLMIATSIDGVDSAMFTMEDNFIKVDDAALKGYGESMTFEILQLTKDQLRLRLVDYGDTTIAEMKAVR
jgi:hypothetical protein